MHSNRKARLKHRFCALVLGALVTQAIPLIAREPLVTDHGMVTSSTQYASDIGVEVLRDGGNAVDAAVAVAYALAVTKPSAGNIGGGGFMVIRLASGKTTAIDYREIAPGAATTTMFQDADGNVVPERSREGPLASGVPGTVAGLAYALEHYGTRNLGDLIAPSIELAADGISVTEQMASSLNASREYLSQDSVARALFVRTDTFRAGDRLKQPELAWTLRTIARHGRSAFYHGAVADKIVATMGRLDGLITHEDLRAYQPKEREPIHGTYRGHDIYAMPPPSSGGVAVTGILGVLASYPLGKWGHNSAKTIHYKTEAERHIYADRNYFLGDPEFVGMPITVLTSDAYYRYLRLLIGPEATSSEQVDHISWHTVDSLRAAVPEHPETTHFSVVDAKGNVVSNTYTINGSYGAGYAIAGAGFLMNNEMDDFSAKPGVPNMYGLIGAEANAVAPRKRMLSSMSPTIVCKDGRAILATGTPGGSTIITTTAQIIMNIIDHGMPVHKAVAAPRVHSQWLPDVVYYEPAALSPAVHQDLRGRGHTLEERRQIGEANSIFIDPATGRKHSGADVTRGGTAAGY